MRAPLMDVYAPPALEFERGEGVHLFTTDGRRYLDFIAGIAVNALGHSHPRLVAALNEQAGKLWHLSNMFETPGQKELAQRYCELSFADRVFFTNSGTESIECALKMARRYHFVKGEPERVRIIGFEGAFHGRSYAAVNAAGAANYLEGFGPRLPGYEHVPYGDLEALEKLVDETTAAVIAEPVQGEGGVRAFTEGELTRLRALTRDRGALLIFDEVQSGASRTGKLFAYQWAEDAEPDIAAIAKGFGGGFPMGACLATEEAAQGMTMGTHGSTYGGNALAMAVGSALLDEISKPEFLAHVTEVSNHLHQGLVGLLDRHSDMVEDVRGKGLLMGMKLKVPNKKVRDAARDRGLLVGVAGQNVLRLAPPLVIEPEHAREAVDILDQTFSALREDAPA